MRKFFTPVSEVNEPTEKGQSSPSPRETTLAFLRQFARAYRPAPAIGMPGIVLN